MVRGSNHPQVRVENKKIRNHHITRHSRSHNGVPDLEDRCAHLLRSLDGTSHTTPSNVTPGSHQFTLDPGASACSHRVVPAWSQYLSRDKFGSQKSIKVLMVQCSVWSYRIRLCEHAKGRSLSASAPPNPSFKAKQLKKRFAFLQGARQCCHSRPCGSKHFI